MSILQAYPLSNLEIKTKEYKEAKRLALVDVATLASSSSSVLVLENERATPFGVENRLRIARPRLREQRIARARSLPGVAKIAPDPAFATKSAQHFE